MADPLQDLCLEPAPDLLLQGIEEFNQGKFFEAHETLEILWRAEARKLRYLYQGILQVGIAFHHLKCNNYRGVASMLERGIRNLERFPSSCQQVDVASLLDSARKALEEVLRLGPHRLTEFKRSLIQFRIRMLEA